MSTVAETRILQVTRDFAFPPERIFDAWLNPEIARRFLFATPTGEIVRTRIDARVGGSFSIVRRDNGEDIEHVGEYLVIDRPRRLVFTFAVPKFSAQFTQVTIEIAPNPGGCTLTLTHEGVPPEWAERTQEGWTMILSGLDDTIRKPFATLVAPDTILLEHLLPGPIERVWEYIADSEKRGKWLGTGILQPKAGTTFTLYLRNSDLSTVEEVTPPQYIKHDAGYHTECRITQCDPPTTPAFLWDKVTEITIRLTPQGDNVLLRLTHRQLTGRTPLSAFAAAWHAHLAFLAAHLSGRDPGSFWQTFAKLEKEYEERKADYEPR